MPGTKDLESLGQVLVTIFSNNFSWFQLEKNKQLLQKMLAIYGFNSDFFWKKTAISNHFVCNTKKTIAFFFVKIKY